MHTAGGCSENKPCLSTCRCSGLWTSRYNLSFSVRLQILYYNLAIGLHELVAPIYHCPVSLSAQKPPSPTTILSESVYISDRKPRTSTNFHPSTRPQLHKSGVYLSISDRLVVPNLIETTLFPLRPNSKLNSSNLNLNSKFQGTSRRNCSISCAAPISKTRFGAEALV